MTLFENIIEDRNSSAKINLKKKTILNTTLGECNRLSKTPTNQQVISIIKKMIESIRLITGDEDEIRILQKYIPQEFTESELTSVISAYIAENNFSEKKDMGKIMKHLSAIYPNQYDGKLASNIIQSILK